MFEHDEKYAKLQKKYEDLEQGYKVLKAQYDDDIAERNRVEGALARQNDSLAKLNKFSIDLARLSSEDNLEEFITKRIKEFCGAKIAVFSEYNLQSRTVSVRHVEVETGLLGKVVNLLGKQVTKIHAPVTEDMYQLITTEVIGSRKTLHEASFGYISRPVGAAIEGVLNVDRFTGVVFLIEGKLFGTALLGMEKTVPDPQKQMLENFVFLAAVSLRRKRAEDELRVSEERYKKAQEVGNIGSWEYNIANRTMWVSDEGKRMFGLNLGAKLFAIEDVLKCIVDKERVKQAMLTLVKDKKPVSNVYSIIPLDTNQMRTIQSIAELVCDESGTPLKITGVIHDITERKMAEELIRESEERFRTLYEEAPAGLYRITTDGRILLANKAMIEMLGYSSFEEIEEKNLVSTGMDPTFPRKRFTEQIEQAGEVKNLEEKWKLANGAEITVVENAKAIKNSAGVTLYYDGMVEDITERKMAEEEIKKINWDLEKLNLEKDKFFSILAHDLKSPFLGIVGLTAKLSKNSFQMTREEVAEYSTALYTATTNIYKLLENLLEWSQIQNGSIRYEPRELNLFDIFSKSVNTVQSKTKQKGITVINKIPRDYTIWADEKMLNSVLRNILSNAVKFTCKGGKVIGNAEILEDGFRQVSVKDDGIGIPKTDQAKLFKLGEKVSTNGTEDEPSTGLGLLLCADFIEKHGGKIWADSEEGKGST
ncbi:MAG: PAS domain-containing sensor histidine kinase, partial [Ignavibacteriales bacterium]|nr:PAS domain-containing sensor histidine kinase [Ignavibacteriales bacterium]